MNNTSEFHCLCPARYYGTTCENKSKDYLLEKLIHVIKYFVGSSIWCPMEIDQFRYIKFSLEKENERNKLFFRHCLLGFLLFYYPKLRSKAEFQYIQSVYTSQLKYVFRLARRMCHVPRVKTH